MLCYLCTGIQSGFHGAVYQPSICQRNYGDQFSQRDFYFLWRIVCVDRHGRSISLFLGLLRKKNVCSEPCSDDLNEANEALQQQQEKIEKINEKLGNQKIKLQAANKRINRSHDEMSVQNEISSSIAASPKRDELLNKVANILHLRLDLDLVMIIMEEDNSLLVPGEEPKEVALWRYPPPWEMSTGKI